MKGRSETHVVGFIIALHGFLPRCFAKALPRRLRWRRLRQGLGLGLGRSKNPCGNSRCVRGCWWGGGRWKVGIGRAKVDLAAGPSGFVEGGGGGGIEGESVELQLRKRRYVYVR